MDRPFHLSRVASSTGTPEDAEEKRRDEKNYKQVAKDKRFAFIGWKITLITNQWNRDSSKREAFTLCDLCAFAF